MSTMSTSMFFPNPTQPSSHSHNWDGRSHQLPQWPSRQLSQIPPKFHSPTPLAIPSSYGGWTGGMLHHHESPASSYPSPSSSDTSYSSIQSQNPPLPRPLPNRTPSSPSNITLKRPTAPTSYIMHPPEYYVGHPLYTPRPIHPPSPSTSAPYNRTDKSTPSSPETMASSNRTFRIKKIGSPRHLQCWDHGCNGRAFSTSSNLLRHQREKAGRVAKTHCPHCDAAFTRTTARNMHVVKGVCRVEPGQ